MKVHISFPFAQPTRPVVLNRRRRRAHLQRSSRCHRSTAGSPLQAIPMPNGTTKFVRHVRPSYYR